MLLAQSARAGIAYSDFWTMTPRDWAAWMEGLALRREDDWRRTRLIYSILFNANVEPRHRRTPEELIPLPGDETDQPPAANALTDEKREELIMKYGLK